MARLEVWEGGTRRILDLELRLAIGRSAGNDLVLPEERVSRQHVLLERMPAGWCARDLGSRNGTFVNGRRLVGEHTLREGDELRVGSHILRYQDDPRTTTVTAVEERDVRPPVTARERDVLIELCRPVLTGNVFPEPASVRQIAAALFVSEAAIKQHLNHLYDKFGIEEGDEPRRRTLATAALQRGVVGVAELRDL